MKRILTLLVAMVSIGAAQAAQTPKYTLYYLDKTRNVVSVGIGEDGKTVTTPKKLTSKGNYDLFDVSPNGRYIVGFTSLRSETDESTSNVWTTYRGFIDDLQAKPVKRTVFRESLITSEVASADWSSKGNYFALQNGGFDVDISVYSAKTGKAVREHSLCTPAITSDERFIAFAYDGPLRGQIVDTKSGIRTWVPLFSFYEAVWIGDTYRLAWISAESDGGLWISDVVSDGTRVTLKDNTQLAGDVTNSYLTYVSGKGVYFYVADNVCLSSDLKTIQGATKPPELPDEAAMKSVLSGKNDVISSQADISPDSKFVACPVIKGKGKAPAIYLFSNSGRLQMVANGQQPKWKNVESGNKSGRDF